MLKILFTLVRGAVASAEQEVARSQRAPDPRSADPRCGRGTDRGKNALALAVAQDEAEGRRLEATLSRIADLEERAAAALTAGRDDLAGEAAEAIAFMEDDRDAIREARAGFAREAAPAARRQRRPPARRSRARAPDRQGRRRRAPAEGRAVLPSAGGHAALAEAEATLRRLRERQAEDAAADAALRFVGFRTASNPLAERMETAGFGRRTRQSAAECSSGSASGTPQSAPTDVPSNPFANQEPCHEPASITTIRKPG